MTRGRGSSDDRLISGKLRGKAARSGADARLVTVDEARYAREYRHGWLMWGKGIKALSISVSLRPGRTRELILDLTLKVGPEKGPPPETRILRALEDGIRSAREAGWDPESRGRAFRHVWEFIQGGTGLGLKAGSGSAGDRRSCRRRSPGDRS